MTSYEAVALNRGIFFKRFCLQKQYLPFPTAADDPFTVTGGSDGRHSNPVGIVNDIHQPACLWGKGSDFTIIPCWHEKKIIRRQDQYIINTLSADFALLNHKRESGLGSRGGNKGKRPVLHQLPRIIFLFSPDFQTGHTWLRGISGFP